jgi:hypothetical protein
LRGPAAEGREELGRLDDRADSAHDVGQVPRHDLVEHRHGAGVGSDQAEEHPDRGRLAGSVGAQEAVHSPDRHVEVEALYGDDPPA